MGNCSVVSAESSTLLVQLRDKRLNRVFRNLDSKQAMTLIVKHQSEFPEKIRTAICVAVNTPESNPERFRVDVYNALKSLLLCEPEYVSTENENNDDAAVRWDGLDSNVDTEEEVEVAIRVFPSVLKERGPRIIAFYPIFWVTTCLEALPFVPLIVELGVELGEFEDEERGGLACLNGFGSRPLRELVANSAMQPMEHGHDYEDFDRQVDEAYLSVLVRLKEKGLMRREDVRDCVEYILDEKPSRTEKRFRFLIDWDPTVLKTGIQGFPLLENSGGLKRFQTIFELGMSHYPEEIGFLFHTRVFLFHTTGSLFHTRGSSGYILPPWGPSCVELVCDHLGKENVTKVVDEVISKKTMGRSDAIQTLVFVAAANGNISLNGLYFFVRRDPNVLFASFSRDV
jgi:hypothetical protein